MCSIQDGTEAVAEPKSGIKVSRTCMKCKEKQAVVVTRVNDAFCRDCFMVYVVHKFRSTIGKSHLIRDGEKVLIAYSGGIASSALLHLVQEGLSERAHKKLRFIPSILHIDDSSVLGITPKEREAKNKAIIKTLLDTGYPSYVSTLEQSLDFSCKDSNELSTNSPTWWDIGNQPELEDFKIAGVNSQLASILETMSSMTAREDFIRNLRLQLIKIIAYRLGYGKVMFGDTSTRLAVRILSDIGQGRGAQVPSDTSFADHRHRDVMFVRPIRELTLKETAVYNQLNKVDTVFVPTLTTKAGSGASIDHLTESFVTGLQAEFPSTVSNITRTAGKLHSLETTGPESECLMCQSPLDTDVNEASALMAVEFSEALSKQRVSTEAKLSIRHSSQEEDRHSNSLLSLDKKDVLHTLCYGCRLTAKDVIKMSHLPRYVTEGAATRITRTKMRENIQDFLLDNNSMETDSH